MEFYNRMGAPYVEIACANMDFYPFDLPGRPDWASPVEEIVPFLQQTQCCNVEVHPTDVIVRDAQRAVTSGDGELFNRVVGSQHMTFFDGRDCRIKSPVFGVYGRLMIVWKVCVLFNQR